MHPLIELENLRPVFDILVAVRQLTAHDVVKEFTAIELAAPDGVDLARSVVGAAEQFVDPFLPEEDIPPKIVDVWHGFFIIHLEHDSLPHMREVAELGHGRKSC